jgi:hypothetical protein
MNVFNKPRETHASVVVSQLKKNDQMSINVGFSLNNENSLTKSKTLSGLCCNCENNTHCDWQRENKVFCEHYQ